MPYKPMKLRDYKRWIQQYGWYIEKGSIDWKLMDENGNIKATVKIIHPPGTEVSANTRKKTEEALKRAGLH